MTAIRAAPIGRALVVLSMAAAAIAGACCGARDDGRADGAARAPSAGSIVRVTGSDTMVNLVQAWAERYRSVRPGVRVQVVGGGSGVGIAGLVDGLCDVAAASREMSADERRRATRNGAPPLEFAVALDALAVYVHRDNPLDAIAIDELAAIYGEDGRIDRWPQLGVRNAGCKRGAIVRVGRQNSSGTYAYFREAILGPRHEYKLGTLDQSGSKDVVALVSRTPCAIGYSGMAYLTPGVKALRIAARKGATAVAPTPETASNGTYPIARRLYLYTPGAIGSDAAAFIGWVLGPDGQQIVRDIGFVPVPEAP